MIITQILLSILLLLAIGLCFYLLMQGNQKALLLQTQKDKIEEHERRMFEMQNSIEEWKNMSDKFKAEKIQAEAEKQALQVEKAKLEGELNLKDEYYSKREKELIEQQNKTNQEQLENLKVAFKNLSNENSDFFKQKSSQSIEEILKPIKEKFEEFDKTIKDNNQCHIAQSTEVKTMIEYMAKQSQAVGEEAKNLANALTGKSKVQGDFGEMLLQTVLKNAGLQEGLHYFVQNVMKDEQGEEIKSDQGKTMIPDIIIQYPDNSVVIVDSKVSLTAFNEYMNEQNSEARVKLARKHVESVKKHVDELSFKDYTSYLKDEQKKIDYNIMYIPMEEAYRLMLDTEPLLWHEARKHNVLIVSQMNLIVVLNMIQLIWRQYQKEKNVEAIYEGSMELMGSIKNWLEHHLKVGEMLNKAMSSYNQANKKLMESNQSVVKKIGKIEKLGVKINRQKEKIKIGKRNESIEPMTVIPSSLRTFENVEEDESSI